MPFLKIRCCNRSPKGRLTWRRDDSLLKRKNVNTVCNFLNDYQCVRAHRFLCSIACTIKLASYDIPLIIQWAENRIGWLNAETAAEFLCCHACDMITISSTA